MKRETTARSWARFKANPDSLLVIQAPLPNFLNTLPILLSIEGQGSVLAGCAPSAPREQPANDK